MPPAGPPVPAPELAAWLAANREPLIRRWLELVVERSTLEELAARPMAERVRELDLLLEAARSDGGPLPGRPDPVVEEMVSAVLAEGGPVALALVAPPADAAAGPEAWTAAIAQVARAEERVAATSDGLTAVVLRAGDASSAGVAADRLRAAAWQALGGASRLPDAGVALHPDDGLDAGALAAAARSRLPEPAAEPDADVDAAEDADDGLPAFDEAEVRAARGDESRGGSAQVTPLYPETFD